jgi:hypothetical protein
MNGSLAQLHPLAQAEALFGGSLRRVLLHRHMPFQAWAVLEEALERGAVSEIGVSNYSAVGARSERCTIFSFVRVCECASVRVCVRASVCIPLLHLRDHHLFCTYPLLACLTHLLAHRTICWRLLLLASTVSHCLRRLFFCFFCHLFLSCMRLHVLLF